MAGPAAIRDTGLGRRVPAGLLDVGAASLGTFLVGFHAASTLSAESLGAYAIFFSAFAFATVIPTQLVLVPAEVASLERDPSLRTLLIPQSIRLASPATAVSILSVLAAVAVARPTVSSGDVFALAIGAGFSCALAPAQDHVRRMLHLAGHSWRASLVSAAKLAGIALAIGGLVLAKAAAEWVPFLSMAIGNGAALVVGLSFVRTSHYHTSVERLHLRDLARSGRWLLVVGLLPAGSAFVCAGLVASLASPSALGYSEAARILAQPILVLAMGLVAVLGPRAMEAAAGQREPDARRVSRLFVGLVLAVSSAYALLVGFDHGWSPLSVVMEKAYAVRGLLLLTLAANTVNAIVFPYRAELVGARREVKLTATEAVGNAARIAIAFTAGFSRAHAIPAGFLALGAVRWVGFRRDLRRLYAEATPESVASDADGTAR